MPLYPRIRSTPPRYLLDTLGQYIFIEMSSPTTSQVAPSSYGILAKLPREVRDQIYEKLLCDIYWRIQDVNCQNLWHNHDCEDLSIMRVSKATSRESLEILFRNCTFVFDFWYKPAEKYIPPLTLVNLSRMRNVEVVFYMLNDKVNDFDPLKELQSASRDQREISLCLFSGESVPRKSCDIRIKTAYVPLIYHHPEELLNSRFGEACKTLLGFEVVRFHIQCEGACTGYSKRHGRRETSRLPVCQHYLVIFGEVLQRFLGSSRTKVCAPSNEHAFCRTLEFHPHDFHA